MNNVVTLLGTDAINLSGMNNVKSFIPSEDAKYAITLESTVKYHDNEMPLHQVLVFNTAPLGTHNPERWYSVVGNTKGVTVIGKKDEPIYVFIVDQITSKDNTGKAVVTFTKVG